MPLFPAREGGKGKGKRVLILAYISMLQISKKKTSNLNLHGPLPLLSSFLTLDPSPSSSLSLLINLLPLLLFRPSCNLRFCLSLSLSSALTLKHIFSIPTNRSLAVMFDNGEVKVPVIGVVRRLLSTGTGQWARRTKTIE